MAVRKRFIAGAKCPTCQAQDTLAMWRENNIDVVECVIKILGGVLWQDALTFFQIPSTAFWHTHDTVMGLADNR